MNDWRVWLLFLSLQIPSLRALAKYVPDAWWPLIPLYFIGTWFVYADLLHDGLLGRLLKRVAGQVWPLLALLVLLFVIQALIYPQADVLKYVGRGNPQDDALVVGGDYLVNGLNPYEALTYRRESVSAGPGWIILALPFTQSGSTGFFNPAWLLVTVLVLWRVSKGFHTPTLFLFILMSCVAFWELTVTGSDMISIGCALLLSTVAAFHAWRRGWVWRALAVLLSAFTATSRIVFAYAIPLIGGFLRRRGWKQSIIFIALAGGLTIGLHLFFYLWNPAAYFPLHRFSNTDFLPGILWPLTAAVASLLVMILAIQVVQDTLESWTLNLWLALTVAMFFSALGDLIGRNFAWAEWEGANYLAVVIPIFTAWIAFRETGQGASAP